MTTMENRPHSALTGIDVQNSVVAVAHETDTVIAHIANLAKMARSQLITVVWVQHFVQILRRQSNEC